MEQTTHRNRNPKVNPKPKVPPPTRPKPSKLSTTFNKVDNDPNSSSVLSKRTNTTPIRGTNVHRLSNLFEDSKDGSNAKSRVVPSCPRSPNPNVTIKKSKSFSNEHQMTNDSIEIDESSLVFDDIKAKFQQVQDRAIPNPTKRPTALTTTHTISKSPERGLQSTTTIYINTNNDHISINDDDFVNFSREWIDVAEDNYLPEIETKSVKLPLTKTLSISRLTNNKPYNDVPSSTKKSISSVSPEDFKAKRESIASLLVISPTIQRNLEAEHNFETSKALPPIPSPKTPTDLVCPSTTLAVEFYKRPKSEISPPSAPSGATVKEERHANDIKRRKKLWNVTKELVETEMNFFHDMVLLEEVYSIPAQEIPIFNPYDCKAIFSNLPEVIDFSAEFSELLERAAGMKDSDDNVDNLENENYSTFIGAAFLQTITMQDGYESRMESVYGEYCKRHEAAVQKLQEFDNDDNVQGWLQKCKNLCEGRTRSWDIASLLIKPVQRVLKYPLLLQLAFEEIQKVAENINEIKRRKDIVEKIVGSKKKTDADIKYATGLSKAREDELYKVYVIKFKNLEQQGMQLIKDVKDWVRDVNVFFEDQQRIAAAFEDLNTLGIQFFKSKEENRKVVEYAKAIKELTSTHGIEMEEEVRRNIIPQIERFLELFKAPAAVMKKREKKILDYDRAETIKSKGGTLDKHLQQSADAFKSISDQLHEELPDFFVLMTQYFDIIVQELIKIQSKLYERMGMDFRQFYYKFVDSQALDHVSRDRELVLREMDVVTEYKEHYERIKMEEKLELNILKNPEGFGTDFNELGRGKRSSWSVPKDHNRKGGLWEDDLEHSKLLYQNLLLNKDYLGIKSDQNPFVNNFNIFHEKPENKYTHGKYLTDSIIDSRSNRSLNNSTLVDDDEITLTGNEETEQEEVDKAIFFCTAITTKRSKQKNLLTFEKDSLLKIIHLDEGGEWWFAVNEETQGRGWVDPKYLKRID
ncbi:9306_t:CDS:10 [Funneliformis mosseae]|uniref:9306_t:CDS:1 n=1 Tax=Funneliformis mosseae TaxID=27381 RepID=A0A9N9A916_FUNMO|nr:9306_t:CDS:10 [Funneliformis mosseae]